MRSTNHQLHGALAALLLAGGCASMSSAGQGFDGRPKQADEKLPVAARFFDQAQRAIVEEAQTHQLAARKAAEEGNVEKARVEFGLAAERYARFADAYPASEWRIAFRFAAAEFHLFAQQHERAAALADQVLADGAVADVTRAMAAQVSAVAWRALAVQKIRAGDGQPLKLSTLDQRAGAPLSPRAPAEPWKRFVQAVDAFLPVAEKYPESARRAADRSLALPAWQAALIAAEVMYSCDQMEDARKRLEVVVQRWPGEPEAMESAIPLLLETSRVLHDEEGLVATRDRMKALLDGQLAKASDGRVREAFTRTRERVVRLELELEFAAAKRLLDGGKALEAAEGFERYAAAHPAAPDAPSALFNAGLAWDKAARPEKAVEVREKLVSAYADAKVAPMTVLFLAGAASKRGDHDASARRYAAYLEKWPEAPNRCLALQNLGYELDVLQKNVEAAERYLAFGREERCVKERPNEVAKALYRSGKLFIDSKQKPKAKDAFEAAARAQGVTDPAAQQMIEDAKRQAKRL